MKILLVRLRQIGDVVFTTPAFSALRDHFPGAALTYLTEPAASDVVSGNPDLAEAMVVPRSRGVSGFLADISLGRALARRHFDIAIDFHGGPRAALLTWLSRAPTRIGYDIPGRGWMYTQQVDRPRTLRARHSVENQWDLLSALGVPFPDRTRYPVVMPVQADTQAAVRARLAAHGVPPGSRLVVLHVSAGNPFRRWPVPSFAEVAAALAAHARDVFVVVTSGPSEVEAAGRVVEQARASLDTSTAARVGQFGDFSLAELRALLEDAALYIGGDSGPMHVAATSRVPMVSLYGPTLPARSEPWRDRALPMAAVEVQGLACRPCDQRVCEPGDYRCLGGIAPAAVVAVALPLLGRTG